MRWADGRKSEGSVWFDGYELRGAEALATYTEGPLRGLAAVTWHRMGKGQIILLGTVPPPQDLDVLVITMCEASGVTRVAQASENLLVVPRDLSADLSDEASAELEASAKAEGSTGSGMVVVEVENRPASLTLPSPMTDLLTGKTRKGTVDVEPYGVMVLKS